MTGDLNPKPEMKIGVHHLNLDPNRNPVQTSVQTLVQKPNLAVNQRGMTFNRRRLLQNRVAFALVMPKRSLRSL